MTKLTSQTVSEIQKYYKREEFGSYVVDPHTAVGLAAQARSQKKAYVPRRLYYSPHPACGLSIVLLSPVH